MVLLQIKENHFGGCQIIITIIIIIIIIIIIGGLFVIQQRITLSFIIY